MFTVKIESYKDILLLLCEIRNMNKYLNLVYMALSMGINLINTTSVNRYKLDKYGPGQ